MSKLYRPSPRDIVCGIERWNGDQSRLGHILRHKDLTIIHGPETVGGINRLELSPRLAMLNRKVFGYIAGIHEADHN